MAKAERLTFSLRFDSIRHVARLTDADPLISLGLERDR